MDVNEENFVSDIVLKEISFAKENLIDFRTEKHSVRYFGPYLWSRLEKHERENINLK